MALLGRTKCCVVGVLVTHAILVLAIVMALVVARAVYEDVVVQDMPGDMRRLELGNSPVFCQELVVTASAERENDADYQTLPLFDAWSVPRVKMDDVKTKQVPRTLIGQNRLEGEEKDYYSFYWMANSTIEVQLNVTSSPGPKAAYWVYFLQGADAWSSMKGQLTADKPTKPPCNEESCLMSQIIPQGGVNVSVVVNTTDEYYMVFYTNYTGNKGSKSAVEPDAGDMDVDDDGDTVVAMADSGNVDDATGEENKVVAMVDSPVAKPAPLGIVWYRLNLDLCVYDTDNPTLKFQGSKQSEMSTKSVDDFIILDFNPDYRGLMSSDLKDFSNIVITMECRARLVSYVAVFGFVALALIIFTVIATLCIINKKFSDDHAGLDIGSGDYTRLVTDT